MNLNESTQHKVTFISQGDCQVCIDRKLLHPILRNLLSNAVKYSPIGSTIDLVLSYQDEKVIFLVKALALKKDTSRHTQIHDTQRAIKNTVSPVGGVGFRPVELALPLGWYLFFAVSPKDRLIGIPYSDQQRLFKPFHRGGNVGNIPGNGLGLALVKKLVDLHGGQISVVSEVGVGTTFANALCHVCQPHKSRSLSFPHLKIALIPSCAP